MINKKNEKFVREGIIRKVMEKPFFVQGLFVSLLAVTAAILVRLVMMLSDFTSFVLTIIIYVFVLQLLRGLVPCPGRSLILILLIGALTFSVSEWGVNGLDKLVLLALLGLLVEGLFFVLEENSLCHLLGVSCSILITFFLMPMALSIVLTRSIRNVVSAAILNLSLLSIISSLIGSLLFLIIWRIVSNKKFIIKLETILRG